jgi:F0F1-type ATP synthase assembly protein I
VGQDVAENRELVALVFRSLEEAFAKGGREEAASALREAFAGRIRSCLIDLPPAEKMKELPEALQQEIRERQRKAARLQRKRDAALQVIPAYSKLLEAYRSYDAEMGSPRRLARVLKISGTTVLVGAMLGYLVERGIGLPYATMGGIGLGVLTFFTMMLGTLSTSRHMTQVESAHATAVERLKEEITAAFEAIDRQETPEGESHLGS